VALISGCPILREGLRLQLVAAGADVVQPETLDALAAQSESANLLLVDAHWNEMEPLPDVSAIGVPAVALLPPAHRAQLGQLSAKGYRAYLIKPVRQDSLERRLMAVAAGASPEISAASQHEETRFKPGLSILLAEDNPVNALLARELLRRRGLDGIEATRRIRAAEAASGSRRLPIFALTADALDTGRKACLAAGMDGFLTKPVDPAELDAVLATIGPPAIVAAE
jgi:CheY-like chemotaxis protein